MGAASQDSYPYLVSQISLAFQAVPMPLSVNGGVVAEVKRAIGLAHYEEGMLPQKGRAEGSKNVVLTGNENFREGVKGEATEIMPPRLVDVKKAVKAGEH